MTTLPAPANPRRRCPSWLFEPLVCLTLAGCGSKLPTVSGQVTYRAAPLQIGRVVFYPQRPTAPAYGTIRANGTYDVKSGSGTGIAVGEYVVTVSAFLPASEPTPSDPRPIAPSLIPERYGKPETSGLKITVAPGANRYDIALED